MKTHFSLASTTAFALLLGLAACGDKPADETAGDTGTAGETATDTSADEVGESGTATTTTTSSDTSTTNDTNMTTTDDGSCPIGSEGCPCTDGGGCDPGLACEGGTCETPASTDTSTDTGTTDTGTTDTGTTDTGTTDTGVDPLPYQACPNGDADCLPDEVCITGTANQGQLPWTMCTSGECNGDNDCAVDDNDVCNDLPGDGQPIDYCVPQICDMQTPCDAPLECAFGFGGGGGGACVWPN